jgi:hypothetical protein
MRYGKGFDHLPEKIVAGAKHLNARIFMDAATTVATDRPVL